VRLYGFYGILTAAGTALRYAASYRIRYITGPPSGDLGTDPATGVRMFRKHQHREI
jgi:hypothetical protein